MPDANERYFDMAVRHQVGIRRFTSGEVKRLQELIATHDRDFADQLRIKLGRIQNKEINFKGQSFKKFISFITQERRVLMVEYRKQVREMLDELATTEVDFEKDMLTDSLPVKLNIKTPSDRKAKSIIGASVFAVGINQARTFDQWTKAVQVSDAQRIVEALQLGVAQGEPTNSIMRRIAGTRKANFTDGILSINRRNAETLVRTATNHISNSARELVWDANKDLIQGLRWTATLDGRTSAICRGRDGQFAPMDNKPLHRDLPRLEPAEARPPAHPNCRSVMVAVIDGVPIADQMGTRPFVRDSRTRRFRERDFRKIAKEQGISIQEARRDWADTNIGTVPAETTYTQWLRRQPASFQNEVLGTTKGKIFRKEKITLDQFLDRRGNELTLAELQATKPALFT